MFKKWLFLALVIALLCPMSAMASMYLGASIGNTWQSATLDADEVIDEVSEISENSTGYKIFGGFKSQSFFGVEGGYRDLGTIDSQVEGLRFYWGWVSGSPVETNPPGRLPVWPTPPA